MLYISKLPSAAAVLVPTPFKSVTGANNSFAYIIIQQKSENYIQVVRHHEVQIQDHHASL